MPAEEERLPNLASQVLVRALFTSGVANDSPALNFKDVNLLGFLNHPIMSAQSHTRFYSEGSQEIFDSIYQGWKAGEGAAWMV